MSPLKIGIIFGKVNVVAIHCRGSLWTNLFRRKKESHSSGMGKKPALAAKRSWNVCMSQPHRSFKGMM